MFFNSIALTTALLAGTSIAEVIWDGRFNATSAADIDKWSWSNQVGAYQYYIHGSGATTDYVNISPDYVNPADTTSSEGARLTIDGTSSWNGQPMMRTELIPSTKAPINKGKKFYHFSLKRSDTNAPDPAAEHQVAFFESHFTELKYGVDGSNGKLQWMTDGKPQFDLDFDAGVWHNIAYAIDFDASTVEFFHSTGADELITKAGPLAAAVKSDGADWHVGVLKFSQTKEDWYFSGVYIEDGELSTAVAGPAGGAGSGLVSPVGSGNSSSSTVPAPTTLQTYIRPSSTALRNTTTSAFQTSASVAASLTSVAEAAPTSADDAGCAVKYVYV